MEGVIHKLNSNLQPNLAIKKENRINSNRKKKMLDGATVSKVIKTLLFLLNKCFNLSLITTKKNIVN